MHLVVARTRVVCVCLCQCVVCVCVFRVCVCVVQMPRHIIYIHIYTYIYIHLFLIYSIQNHRRSTAIAVEPASPCGAQFGGQCLGRLRFPSGSVFSSRRFLARAYLGNSDGTPT